MLNLMFIFISSFAMAALPPLKNVENKTQQEVVGSQDLVALALRLPINNRVEALSDLGDRSVEGLKFLVFDNEQSLQLRWRAMTALGRLHPQEAEPVIDKALQSREWYMRNAALLALEHGDRERALRWTRQLLSDPALVVRTAAVQTATRIGARELEAQLWDQLYAEQNFKNGESLWVRRHIAKTLAGFASPGQEERFVRLLGDKDVRVHPWAIRALERLTGEQLAAPEEAVEIHRSRWLARMSGS